MSCTIKLDDHRHKNVKLLLPWYVTGQIEAADAAAVETHLAGCANCSADLDLERRLGRHVSTSSLDAELSWAAFEAQARSESPRARASQPASWIRQRINPPQILAGALFANAACAVFLFAFMQPSTSSPADFRAMSGAAAGAGDAIIMFNRGATEEEMRASLTSNRATIVDGPNSVGAYTIALNGDGKQERLRSLGMRPDVAMAARLAPVSPQ